MSTKMHISIHVDYVPFSLNLETNVKQTIMNCSLGKLVIEQFAEFSTPIYSQVMNGLCMKSHVPVHSGVTCFMQIEKEEWIRIFKI